MNYEHQALVDQSPIADAVHGLTGAVDDVVERAKAVSDNMLSGLLPGEDYSELTNVMNAKVEQWAELSKELVYTEAASEIQLRGGISGDDIDAIMEAQEVVEVGFYDQALKRARHINRSPQQILTLDPDDLQPFLAGVSAIDVAADEDPEHVLGLEDIKASRMAADQLITQISNGFVIAELARVLEERLTLADNSPELVSSMHNSDDLQARHRALLRVVEDFDAPEPPEYDGQT